MRRAFLLCALAACKGGEDGSDGTTTVPGDDDDDLTPSTLPPCDSTAFVPIVEEYEYVTEEVDGTIVLRHLPPTPRAIVWGFHGRGGTAEFFLQPHYLRLWNLLGDIGVGIVAVDSEDRTMRQWDKSTRDPEGNADMANLATIRDHYVAAGLISEATPMFSWGFSDGGGFTEYWSDMALELGWPVRGNLVHNSQYVEVAPIPTFFTSSENDDFTEGTRASSEAQVDAGHASEFHETFEYPFTAEVMLLNPQYDLAKGQEVVDELANVFGYIDADGVRLVDVDQVDALLRVYQTNSTVPGAPMVDPLLRVAWATHRPSSEYACAERDFVAGNL